MTAPTPGQATGQVTGPRPPVILGIAGFSGSGKTALARALRDRLGATLLPLDAYYRDLAHLAPGERDRQNFDHPDALDIDLLLQHLGELARGHPIDRPCYDFVTHTRKAGVTEHLEPTPVILVEGVLALHDPRLRAQFGLAVYVETPPSVFLSRRIQRDARERGRTESSVRQQYAATAGPMAEQYVRPSARHASVVVNGAAPLKQAIGRVLGKLRDRRLLS